MRPTKREELVRSAMQAFYRNGFHATGMDFDELQEWFYDPDFHGCMFIMASSEHQDRDHPIRKQSADHKRMLQTHISKLAEAAGLTQPDQLPRQLLLLAEGAIVTVHMKHTESPAGDARQAALALVAAHEPRP